MVESGTISEKSGEAGGTINKPKKRYKGVCVKVYFNEPDFVEIAKDAEKAGKRRVGLVLFTQKSHGFQWERLANTDGIAKAMKYWWKYWQEAEPERLQKRKEAELKRQQAEEELKKLGGIA